MSGKQLPTKMDALKHMAFLQQNKPKSAVMDLALETVDIIEVYWKMAKIPTQESTKGPMQKVYAAKRLRDLWMEYKVCFINVI